MADAIIDTVMASKDHCFMHPFGPYIAMLFERPSPSFLNWLIKYMSPHINWRDDSHGEKLVVQWCAAVLAVQDKEEVSQSVVSTLLQIASVDSLQPHIPVQIWEWVKSKPSLPPLCWGWHPVTTPNVIRYIQGLGDLEIIKSYFLLVWSEWENPQIDGLEEMEISIRKYFVGTEMCGHREDLIKQLDYVLGQLGLGLEHLKQHNPWVDQYCIEAAQGQYNRLKGVLLDMERKDYA